MKTLKAKVMMLGLVAALLSSCAPKGEQKQETKREENILIGWIKPDDLLEQFPLYKEGLLSYHPDSLAVERIKALGEKLEILAFIGTWCPDSRRDVPRLLKALQLAANPKIKLRIYGLDYTKRDKAGLTEKYNIQYVPTFVFLSQGKEIGRIVEVPERSVEQDFVKIVESN